MRSGYSTLDHIFSLKCIIYIYLFKNKIFFTAFIDYPKAFDNICRISLWRKLLQHNINGNIFNVKIGINRYKTFFSCNVGVRQGENLSLLLLSIFHNDMA